MYRFKPKYEIKARHIDDFPYKSKQAAAIQLMLSNNLDNAIAQHPYELITYGGNGSVFQNWAQYLLCMQFLAKMTDEQTLVLYSGHPMGLFPSSKNAPRVVVTNGMMIPNYSKPDDWEKFNALGVTQYGQMTAGSFMYIGPQGIVHGTTITILNAARKIDKNATNLEGKIQKAFKASYPPGEATEDWKIINDLSALLKRKKLYKNKEELIDSMMNYIKLNKKDKNSKIIETEFLSEKILIDPIDYYYSNVIARSSNTMSECRSKKLKIKPTGTDG